MKNILTFFLLFPIAAFALELRDHKCKRIVTLPNSEILAKRFDDKGFGSFDQVTGLSNKFGQLYEKKTGLNAIGVHSVVFQAIHDFNKYTGNDGNEEVFMFLYNQFAPTLITICLEDSPEAIDCLKEHKLLSQ